MGSITVTGLGKAYKQYFSQWSRLAEWVDPRKRPRHRLRWVLSDINFSVEPGEAVGIVGINGAGKSTLLKIITGTTQPTKGSVSIHGRVAALLELGMGFHPDFTGRQNAFMAGQLLGHSIAEIERLMPSIEAFAEIGEYIDQPVRVYSSGMQVRLAFSVATAVRPDVLIVDEALSVGDRYFSQKSFDRIQSFLDSGTTLLFVSHDSTAIKTLCDRAVLMEGGRITMMADPESVIDRYNGLLLERANKLSDKPAALAQPKTAQESTQPALQEDAGRHAGGRHVDGFREMHAQVDSGEVALTSFRVFDKDNREVVAVNSGEEITIRYSIKALKDLDDLYMGFSIRNNLAVSIFNTNTHALHRDPVALNQGESCEVVFRMKLPLQAGQYGLCMGIASGALGPAGFSRYLINVVNAEVIEVMGNGVDRFGGIVNLAPICELAP
ncbi:lipopolysaccharide transport system ATP-binding protein [Paraburkholderia eburnea]|uniref:Lipopolysaccharide transport system ATP-binding protein n=1 Tax=Paraburkholderia eburnea TaxID=1189126 RepID=A0A2S4MMA4_9BURK|nr:ABC transporter ATP-binding protein [Paraburkholderia eburnea]POR55918.1 lipopolysaccharide transport system ATP-binding protein [Paraburkholderia eburnea]PRZ27045.1 lipopolysaccharide transport system ATP-binding protein [Paraburkholderia eburnea]